MQLDSQGYQCLHKLVETQAFSRPDATALVYEDNWLSYGELDRRANQLGHHLQKLGVGLEVRVGVCMERCLELVIGLLGILKAGGAYVPLDPNNPLDRLAYMLADAQIPIVLTGERQLDKLPSYWGHSICLDRDWEVMTCESEQCPESGVNIENLAYVTYTSGSTGSPKGSEIPHRSIPGFMTAIDCIQFDEDERSLQYASISWDVLTLELWPALVHGGRCILYAGRKPTPSELGEAISRYDVNILWLTSSFFNVVMDTAPEALAGIGQLMIGGEALSVRHVRRATEFFPMTRIVNGYGPSECTVFTCCFPIPQTLEENIKSIPIGRPIGDRKVYLLNSRLNRVPIGVPGELHIGGPSVARGYQGQPDLTAEKFIPNSFVEKPGARLYRTGDQVRYLSDGRMEFLGRIDDQVKIRGFRIELGEVESELGQCSGVRQGVVAVREDEPGDKRLVAYVVIDEPQSLTITDLRRQMKERLPEYMVPSVFVQLQSIPLTSTGKVDRQALPVPDVSRLGTDREFVAPSTAAEQILAEIWADVLRLERVSICDNYFDLGGDSIRSIQLAARAKEKGLSFSIEQLFEHPTIEELALAIGPVTTDAAISEPHKPFVLISEADREKISNEIEDAYPLTRLQAGMIFHSEYSPETAVYHDIASYHFRAVFDNEAMRSALRKMINRHAVLRTSFDLTGFSEPMQLVHQAVDLPLEVEDLQHLTAEEQEALLSAALEREKGSQFDWRQAPLLRVKVYKRSEETFQFIVSFHHAILDGWSLATFFTELCQHYWFLLGRRTDDIGPAPNATFSDYVALERQSLESDECRRFWLEKLRGNTSGILPRWPAASEATVGQIARKGAVLSPEVIGGLNRLAVTAGVQLKSIMLAAHLSVLSLISGRRDVMTGLAAHGRTEGEDAERVLGLFLNTLPFRLQLSGGSWQELARKVFEAEREILPFRRYPLAEMQQGVAGQPLLETLFSFLHFHVYQELQGLQSEMALLGRESIIETNFPLATHILRDPFSSVVQLILDYDKGELCSAQIDALMEYYLKTLAAIATDPSGRYDLYSPQSEAERHQLLLDWNDTQSGYIQHQSIHELLEQQVQLRPDAIAICSEREQLTYQQLNERANQLAHYLQALGVEPESKVGVYMKRSPEMVIALSGILKAGGAYVHLDLTHYQDQLALILADCDAQLVLTEQDLIESLPKHNARLVCLDSDRELIAELSRANPAEPASADHLACIIYPAESSGHPRGAEVLHRGVLRFVKNVDYVSRGADERILQAVPSDASTLEIYAALLNGGCLVLNEGDVPTGEGLRRLIGEQGVSTMWLTPPLFNAVIDEDAEALKGLKQVLIGGEALSVEHVRRGREVLGEVKVIDGYGPTEATAFTFSEEVRNLEGNARSIAIGRPTGNTEVYVLDEWKRPVPVGGVGELHIAGEGLGRGYHRRAEQTAEWFIPNPFDPHSGSRLFRTGELARYRPDGRLELLGRTGPSEDDILVFDPRLKQEKEYWINRLSREIPATNLMLDFDRPQHFQARTNAIEVHLPADLLQKLEVLTSNAPFLLYTTLLAALKICLHKYTRSGTVSIGSPAMAEVEAVKLRANALAIVDDIDDGMTFREFLLEVRETLLEAYARQRYPFNRLIKDLELSDVANRCPLFDIVLALKGFHGDLPELNNDITISFAQTAQQLCGRIAFNNCLFSRESIEWFRDHFVALLSQSLEDTARPLYELRMLTDTETNQLVREWNKTEADYASDRCIHQLFEAQVEKRPDSIAVVFGSEMLSYSSLNARANQLARYLRAIGVGPDSHTGMCVGRSPEMLVVLLAILKAGGAYVPLDPSYPKSRLAFMLEDAQVEVLLTEERMLDALPDQKSKVTCVEECWEAAKTQSEENLSTAVGAGNLAYIIYTSGSTGKPKGVLVQHGGLCNLADAQIQAFDLQPESRVLQFASLSFDASIFEIIMALQVGATLYFGSQDALLVGHELSEFLKERAITNVTLPPSVLLSLGAEQLNALETIVVAGEACSADLVVQWSVGHKLFNAYGPTEATVWVSVAECLPTIGRPTIGKPIMNTQVYILDSHMEPAGIGVPGELHVGGVGLARGYLNRPGQTAEKFVPNPFGERPGARLYRTGDLVRYLPGGEMEFIGRIDHQVKIRGYRIELGELELILLQHPAVAEAVVLAREDEPGKQRLVGYYVAAGEGAPASNELRSFVKERLPDYMVPSTFVRLEALPLTVNGKVDRKALPTLDKRPEMEAGGKEFRTPEEEILTGIWSQVLGTEKVGIHDNFFDLGGHSLLATQVMSCVRETFQVEIPLRELFVSPTVSGLAGRIRDAKRDGRGLSLPPIVPVTREQHLPLSFAQQRLWFVDQLIPDSALYNNPTAVRLSGSLNIAAIEQSLKEIVRRHEVLRTTFAEADGGLIQAISPAPISGLPIVDLCGLTGSIRSREAERLANEESRRPFDLSRGPLLRVSLLRLDDRDNLVLLTMHHIVTDGWSIGIFTREVTGLYDAFSGGAVSPLPEPAIQYADFAHWQRQWLQGEALDELVTYWKRQLGDNLPTLQLPTDRPRPAVPTWRGETQSHLLPGHLLKSLHELSRKEGVTLFMTLLAAFQTLLHRYSGQDDIVVGTDIANRHRRETEELIGLFVNLLVLRTDLSRNPSFLELLRRVREVTLGAYAHQDLPFDKLVEELRPERNPSLTPLFQVLFVLQNAPVSASAFSGLILEPAPGGNAPSRFDLTLSVIETGHGLLGTWRYNTDIFDSATITRMAKHFEALLGSIVAQPRAYLDGLEMFTEDEKRQRAFEEEERQQINFKKFRNVKPRVVTLPAGELIKTSLLRPGQTLPLVVQPATANIDLMRWSSANREFIEERLLKHGAILFRGFNIRTTSDFEAFAQTVCEKLFREYGDLPRENVSGNVYTSTPYPPEQPILFHNESSHLHQWPGKIFFFCVQPPAEGGETPIVDCRSVLRILDPEIIDRFEQKKLLYLRNYIRGLDVSWQEFFRTTDQSAVEAYCRTASIEFQYIDTDRLITRKICEAVIKHPKTGEKVFFNQVQLHHPSCLDPDVRSSLLSLLGEQEDLPRNVFYGDGSRIEDSAMAEIRRAYDQAAVSFAWQRGDVLMLDNVLTAHGRNPFVGPRKILVAMGEMMSRDQVDDIRIVPSHVEARDTATYY